MTPITRDSAVTRILQSSDFFDFSEPTSFSAKSSDDSMLPKQENRNFFSMNHLQQVQYLDDRVRATPKASGRQTAEKQRYRFTFCNHLDRTTISKTTLFPDLSQLACGKSYARQPRNLLPISPNYCSIYSCTFSPQYHSPTT